MTKRLWTTGVLVLLLLAACDALSRKQGSRQNPSLKAGTAAKHGRISKSAMTRSGVTAGGTLNNPELVTLKATKMPTFNFSDDLVEQQLKESGKYVPTSVLLYDVTADVVNGNRLFVTTPMVRSGVPASLSTVPLDGAEDPPLTPYPNLDVHRTTVDSVTDCHSQIVSAVTTTKTWMDDSTLYVLDSGVHDISTSPKHVCRPKILAFNLLTDEIRSSTDIQNTACNSLYIVTVVEECPAGSLVAYSADLLGFRLTVTDLISGDSKHLQSQYFYPVPAFFFTKAGGPSFYLPYGLCGVAADDNCGGKVYMQAFASNIQDVVDKEVIRNASDGDVLDTITQVALSGRLSGSNGPLAVDPSGQLVFFPIQDDLAIYCWNTSKPHDPQNFRMIAQDSVRLRYISSLKIERETERLYIQTNRFTSYRANTLDYSEDNYYILFISISGLHC